MEIVGYWIIDNFINCCAISIAGIAGKKPTNKTIQISTKRGILLAHQSSPVCDAQIYASLQRRAPEGALLIPFSSSQGHTCGDWCNGIPERPFGACKGVLGRPFPISFLLLFYGKRRYKAELPCAVSSLGIRGHLPARSARAIQRLSIQCHSIIFLRSVSLASSYPVDNETDEVRGSSMDGDRRRIRRNVCFDFCN